MKDVRLRVLMVPTIVKVAAMKGRATVGDAVRVEGPRVGDGSVTLS